MPYVVDFKKQPKQLLFELFKEANDLPFSIDDLSFSNVSASQNLGFNSKADVRWASNHEVIGKINVYYNRMDLSNLFWLSGLTVIEINLDSADGTLVLNDKVFAEVERRYGVKFAADDFDLLHNDEGYWLIAKESNLAYQGKQPVSVTWSLATRVRKPVLNGFEIIEPNNFIPSKVTIDLPGTPISVSDVAILPRTVRLLIPTVVDTVGLSEDGKHLLVEPIAMSTLSVLATQQMLGDLPSAIASQGVMTRDVQPIMVSDANLAVLSAANAIYNAPLVLPTIDLAESSTLAVLPCTERLNDGFHMTTVIMTIEPMVETITTTPSVISVTGVLAHSEQVSTLPVVKSNIVVLPKPETINTSLAEITSKAIASHTGVINDSAISCVPVNTNYLLIDPLTYDGVSDIPSFGYQGVISQKAYDGGSFDSPAIAYQNPVAITLGYN